MGRGFAVREATSSCPGSLRICLLTPRGKPQVDAHLPRTSLLLARLLCNDNNNKAKSVLGPWADPGV